jgi:hypothetical protein
MILCLVNKPVTYKPVTHKPVTHKPVTFKPVTPKPVTPKPVTPKPVTPKPATSKLILPRQHYHIFKFLCFAIYIKYFCVKNIQSYR